MARSARLHFLLSCLFVAVVLPVDARLPEEQQLLRPAELPWRAKASRARTCSPHNSRWKREKGAVVFEVRHQAYCSTPGRNRTKRLLAADEARVRYLQAQVAAPWKTVGVIDELSAAQIPLVSGIKLQTLNYIVTVELGGKKTTLIMDTGSDLTWVQCKPCTYCYNQLEPLYDPSASPSYQPIPCNSSTCSLAQIATGSSGICGANKPRCNYVLSYGDGSYSRGELARDRINLGGTWVEGFIFGCGRSNRGLFGGVSGLMGLGRSPISLIAQTAAQFGGAFSYCLPSREYDSSGSLSLGGDYSLYKNTTALAFTRIISDPRISPFYLLNLTGMSLGGVPLQASGFSTGKFLIDSGTVVTRLPPSVYEAARTEFLRQFSTYPPAPGFSILTNCFNLTGYREVSIPTLKMQFEGGTEITIDASGMLYFVKKDVSQACLALASLSTEGQLGILGNYQQKNLRVVYDTATSRVGFAQETCSYN